MEDALKRLENAFNSVVAAPIFTHDVSKFKYYIEIMGKTVYFNIGFNVNKTCTFQYVMILHYVDNKFCWSKESWLVQTFFDHPSSPKNEFNSDLGVLSTATTHAKKLESALIAAFYREGVE